MIELRVLNGASLLRADGVEARSVLAQPKRFALLVYLALAGGRGFHRRDTLLAFFWPEADEEHARGSLRTSLHFLRSSLGENAIDSRGADEVGVRADVIRSDVAIFEGAAAEGRWEAALAAYAGPLLPGFNIENAPAWDEWLDAERLRLSRMAAECAWNLANHAREAGRAAEAAAWGRQAISFTPYEEEPVRRLMTLLADVGDRSAALLAYEQFVARMAQEMGTQPSAKTRDLAGMLRVEDAAPSAVAAPPAPAPAPDPEPARAAPAPGTGSAVPAGSVRVPSIAVESPRKSAFGGRSWHRPAAVLGGLVLLLISAALLSPLRRSDGARVAVPPASERLVVLPFSVRGVPHFDYLGEGMVDLLGTALDGAGPLQTVDPRAVLGIVAGHRRTIAPDDGRRTAERFSARFYILGGVVAAAEHLQLSASLYDRKATSEPVVTATVNGPSRDLFRLVELLSTRLLTQHLRNPGDQMDRVAAQTTPSLAALKLYLQGAQHLRMGRFDLAVEMFSNVLAEDSTFAMAAYQLSLAAEMAGHESLPADAGQLALRHARYLPPLDRLLLEARMSRGEAEHAKRLYSQILAIAPDRVEAWYQLADILFHEAPVTGQTFTESETAFRQVLQYEPRHAAALQHLARIAAVEAKLAAVDSFTAGAAGSGAGELELEMNALRFLALGDRRAGARVVERLGQTPDNRIWITAWRAANHSGNYLDAWALIRVLAEPTRSLEVRAYAHVALAHMELASGRPGAAERELREAERLRPGSSVPHRVSWAPFPFLTGRCERDEELRSAVMEVAAFAAVPSSLPSAGRYHLYDDDLAQKEYLQALLAACGSERDDVMRRLSALSGKRRGPTELSAVVVAQAAAAGKVIDIATAREGLSASAGRVVEDAHSRYLRAELSRRAHEPGDALRWFGTMQNDLDYLASVYVAPSYLQRARILDRQQRRGEAAREYRRFAAIWRDAEPELRPLVEQALRRAAALSQP
ncbi:hypothetical protein BH23GEM3_BH23GEM3_08750 [soil metagenome]